MNILEQIRSFEFDKNRKAIFGIKSAIIWGHSKKTNGQFPMLYITKPKGISQSDFELLLDCLNIQIFYNKDKAVNKKSKQSR